MPSRLCFAVLGRPGLPLAERAAAAGYPVSFAELVIGTREAVPDGIRHAASIEDAVRDADLVIDFVPDELESKLEVLTLLDRMAPPRAILLTPTQALSIRDLASCTYRADRVVGLRFGAEQVQLMHGPEAAPEVLATVAEFWSTLGSPATTTADLQPLP